MLEKTDAGLQYKIYTSESGRKAKAGDIIKLHLVTKTEGDSVLSSSYTMGQPIQFRLTEPTFKGDFMEGLTMLSIGDSASFMVSAGENRCRPPV